MQKNAVGFIPALLLAGCGLLIGCGSGAGPVSQAGQIPNAASATPTPLPDATSVEATTTATPEPTPTAVVPSANPEVGTTRRPGAAAIEPDTIAAAASSQLASVSSFSYGPRNTLDDNPTTAWNHDSQNNVISGEGQQLTFQFASATRIDRIEIVNGYAQSDTAFSENARVARLLIVPDSGGEEIVWPLADSDQLQSIDNLGFVNVSTLELIVETVYPGSAYLDTAITDVYFFTYGPPGT